MQNEPDVKRQMERFERAARRPELLRLLPRVAAAGFGVLPLDEGPGWIEVASTPTVTADALRTLSRLLERDLRVTRVPETLVHFYLQKLYPDVGSVNFHTFLDAGFLERPGEARLLLSEKEHSPIPPHDEGSDGELVLLDYAYRSELCFVDGSARDTTFEAGSTDLGFLAFGRGDRVRAVMHRKSPVPDDVRIVARESYATSGGDFRHGWRHHEVKTLPFLVHPTELQVTGIDSDGSLDFLIYDEVEKVRPGEAPRFTISYHFLSMGQRLLRRLALKVYGVHRVSRSEISYTDDPLPWTPAHLTRWFGQDLETVLPSPAFP